MAEDFELTLFDRLEVIRTVLKSVPDERCYISFSGGKDSTILSRLVDEAIPNNKIKRVFCNTGLEHHKIVEFVEREKRKTTEFKLFRPLRTFGRC